MQLEEAIRLFSLNNLAIEAEIQRIEKDFGIDLGHFAKSENNLDQTYYPQFKEHIRDEASRMARNYIIFYCLENSIRNNYRET